MLGRDFARAWLFFVATLHGLWEDGEADAGGVGPELGGIEALDGGDAAGEGPGIIGSEVVFEDVLAFVEAVDIEDA